MCVCSFWIACCYLSRGKAPRKQLPKQARTKPHQFHSVVGQVAEKEENTWVNSFHIGEEANMMC